jgi:uncharacterized protein YsxB (DUF464 family)
MLVVNVKKSNNIIEYVKFNGHALYDDYGKDIVCASASSIYITTVNAILSFDKDAISYNKDNEVINLKKDDITNKLLINMVNMLKELERDYKKNIKIVEE